MIALLRMKKRCETVNSFTRSKYDEVNHPPHLVAFTRLANKETLVRAFDMFFSGSGHNLAQVFGMIH
jgi:hypothetical protein